MSAPRVGRLLARSSRSSSGGGGGGGDGAGAGAARTRVLATEALALPAERLASVLAVRPLGSARGRVRSQLYTKVIIDTRACTRAHTVYRSQRVGMGWAQRRTQRGNRHPLRGTLHPPMAPAQPHPHRSPPSHLRETRATDHRCDVRARLWPLCSAAGSGAARRASTRRPEFAVADTWTVAGGEASRSLSPPDKQRGIFTCAPSCGQGGGARGQRA